MFIRKFKLQVSPAYKIGAACPFDRTKRSLEGSLGLDSLYLITWKKRTDIASAIEAHDVGCLEV